MKIVPIVLMVILIAVLVYFLYMYYTAKTNSLTTVTKMNLNNSNAAIPTTSLTSPQSTRYAYGFWVYVNTWNSTLQKNLFYRSGSPPNSDGTFPANAADFNIYLDTTSPTLNCVFKSSTANANPVIPITTNFPIQKWTQVIVSVDDSVVDFYIDGKLVVSTQLPNLPVVSSNDINFGSPYDIYLAQLNRWPSAVDPNTAWSSYLSGSSSLGSSTYNVQLAVFKDQVETNTFNIV